jgi:hypothetical protein
MRHQRRLDGPSTPRLRAVLWRALAPAVEPKSCSVRTDRRHPHSELATTTVDDCGDGHGEHAAARASASIQRDVSEPDGRQAIRSVELEGSTTTDRMTGFRSRVAAVPIVCTVPGHQAPG